MAASLAQGGPAPNFFMPWCYKVLCTGFPDFDSMDQNGLTCNIASADAAV